MRQSAIERSRERGWAVPIWLTVDRLERWLADQPVCPCCAVVFTITRGNGLQNSAPSLDRLDSGIGYEESNVRLICWRCNNIKRDFTADDLERVARWVRSAWGNQAGKFDASA